VPKIEKQTSEDSEIKKAAWQMNALAALNILTNK